MIDRAVHSADGQNVETVLREELARGDAMAQMALPVLRHLVAAGDSSDFSDEILARIRAMLADLANALLAALPDHTGQNDGAARPADEIEALTRALLDDPALLSHLHAQAIEWQLTERLQVRLALDAVMSPLLQELISAPDHSTQELAMKFLAAQTRWCQAQRRMTLPLPELPTELVRTALAVLCPGMDEGEARAQAVEAVFRERYDERTSRVGLASRLITSLGEERQTALSVDQAGVALFLTAVALGSGHERDAVVLSTHEARIGRLALALRSTGLDAIHVERQILALHPDIALPSGLDRLDSRLAATILSSGHVSG